MKSSKGFTLIELIVVMAIFLFIVGAAIGIFLSMIQSQKRALSEEQFLNQISYVEEYMSKALRMAKTETTEDCVGKGYIYLLTTTHGSFKGIKFLNQSDEDSSGNPACEEFYLDGSGTVTSPFILKELKNSNNNSDAVALTPANLQFDPTNPIRFVINGDEGDCNGTNPCGALDSDGTQPRVTILLNIAIANDSTGKVCSNNSKCGAGQACISGTCVYDRTIQTTVSRRNLNVLNIVE